MRISKIQVGEYRNLRNIRMMVPADARLVCIVGANGSGKSNLLNLISGAAFHFGLSPGIDPERRVSLAAYRDLEVTLTLEGETKAEAARLIQIPEPSSLSLTFSSASQAEQPRITYTYAGPITAGGGVASGGGVAAAIVQRIREDAELHYLEIDPARAYPSLRQNAYTMIAQALQSPRPDPKMLRSQAFKAVRAMYESWLQFMIREDLGFATSRASEEREAALADRAAAPFIDPWQRYNDELRRMLPYLHFSRFSPEAQALTFRSHGTEVTFEDLSSGEQEIAFIIGQIERFKLQRGLLLLDEPELHLNHQLIRRWIRHLRDSAEHGQVWIATHSLEAVESAGADFTYLIEQETSGATPITKLSAEPSIQLLSDALGSPAYSVERNTYIFVEGSKSGTRERERFEQLISELDVSFVEVAGAADVRHYVGALRSLRLASGNPIRVGGIVDRDVRSELEIQTLCDDGLLVLDCHEIENLYVEPKTVAAVAELFGRKVSVIDIVRDAADRGAGRWCAQAALSTLLSRPLLRDSYADFVGKAVWQNIDANRDAFVSGVVQRLEFHPTSPQVAFEAALRSSIALYSECRAANTLWKYYFGKELLGIIPPRIGITDGDGLINAAVRMWKDHPELEPDAVKQVRKYAVRLTRVP